MKERSSSLKTIWFFLKPHKYFILFLFLLCVLIAIFETLNIAVLYPILQGTMDIESGQNTNFFLRIINNLAGIIHLDDVIIANLVIFILLTVLFFIFRMVYLHFSLRFTARIVEERKEDIFQKFMNADYQFYVDNKQGDLLFKVTSAPLAIAVVLNELTQFLVEILMSVSTFILLFSLSWIGSSLAIALGAGYYLYIRYLSSRISYVAGVGKRETSMRENVIVNEYITGVKTIKAFDSSPYWGRQFGETIRRYWAYWKRSNFWFQAPGNMINLVLFSLVGLVVIIVRIQNPGNFATIIPIFGTFAFAIFRLLPRLSSFGIYQMQIMDALPRVEVVYDLLRDTTYDKIRGGSRTLEKFNRRIEFRNVKFTHKKRETTLDDISLTIEKGRMTAIVGASGSGKSTIVDLLLRLYDVNGGGIYVDDVDIKEYKIPSILKKMGFVGQETFIFNASIKDNISFGSDYTLAEITGAAKLANAHEFIQQLPEGYDTPVGDRGAKLSGGEKQRIAIARAMIRKPEILILDEATSSLDNISEKIVQEAINKVAQSCTTLVIAHRLSTIKNAEMIYVLDKRKIVESGNHEQLIRQKGKYRDAYE